MSCKTRKTKGHNTKGCPFIFIGEDTCGDVWWCSDCGIILSGDKKYNNIEIQIPAFDPQTDEPN